MAALNHRTGAVRQMCLENTLQVGRRTPIHAEMWFQQLNQLSYPDLL